MLRRLEGEILAGFEFDRELLVQERRRRILCWSLLCPLWCCMSRHCGENQRGLVVTTKGIHLATDKREKFIPFLSIEKITQIHAIPGVLGELSGLTALQIQCKGDPSAVRIEGLQKPQEFIQFVAATQSCLLRSHPPLKEIPRHWLARE
jgi:hypothetical protein